MDQTLIALLAIVGGLLALLGAGVWVAIALAAVAGGAMALFTQVPVANLAASALWEASWQWPLTALPLFIWMGEILFRTRLSQDMFNGLGPWVEWLPGRLLHVNVLGCGIMAAVAGSSAVTATTVGRMSLPELQKRGYSESAMIGTLAGSGTLGLIIPPSVVLIVYGVLSQQSVARLFVAGLLPGLLLVALFMGYVMIWSLLHRDRMPPKDPRLTLGEKLRRSSRLFPIVALIAAVIGSIYSGIATPTESATFGILGALLIAACTRALSWASFCESLMAAMRISCMIAFIIVTAAVLSTAVAFIGIPQYLASLVEQWQLSPGWLLLVLTLIFIVLGCFLEGVSILVLSSAVVLPMLQNAGIDLLWFGIYVVIIIEMAQITPPVGFNLFVLQSITGRDIWQVTRAAIPFFLLLCLVAFIIALFPGIVTWLPSMSHGR
ncbi:MULTISPECIES: TRAP transporter large permease subunit [unclassified Modicisalibacter]|uniref:TRAP transporter large permease n=1 Tax=unclassified Modicisalibacter TaxID=2679913 RepID=UPI001CCAE0DE|nr:MULTISPECIES: TRAP transporter large permease subunit [unclassified Modicisalibacter]MBZ9558509.1 TRAP transporter large permease subunit [Modicisalibacter sp. R2A 31.J]MBZ9575599.1 TRAP transporter large permease subunit [Modicisalibacter sp. MOD 31.J]